MDRKLEVGSSIIYVDAHAKEHNALVTVVWSAMSGQEGEPGCNLVFVSGDDSKTDPYGRQIERSTSVVHRSKQPAHGNYWDWPSK
jgi:hypothetical protein